MSIADLSKRIKDAQTNDEMGFRASTYATDYIYQGKCFSTSQRLTIESANNMFILFDITGAYSAGRVVSVYTPVLDTTTGPLHIDYYYASDYTGGTSFLVNNRVSYGGNCNCTLTYGATDAGGGKGIKFTEGFVASGHKSTGTSQEGLEFVPPQNTKILVEIDNTNGSNATAFVNFVWFEV